MSNEIMETTARTKETVVADIKATMGTINSIATIGAISIGNDLKTLKELVPHGEWISYIEENLQFSERKTQRFIQIAETYGDENSSFFKLVSNPSTLSDLSVSKALSLLSIDEEDVETFVEEVKIEEISTKELEEEIRKYKEDNDRLQAKITETEDRISQMESSSVAPEELEKEKQKADNLKDKLRKLEEKQAKEIQEAKTAAKEEARKEASEEVADSLRQLETERAEAEARADAAEKKASNVGNETLLKFKLAMDLIQQQLIVVHSCVAEVEEMDPDKAQKMRGAMDKVLERG